MKNKIGGKLVGETNVGGMTAKIRAVVDWQCGSGKCMLSLH